MGFMNGASSTDHNRPAVSNSALNQPAARWADSHSMTKINTGEETDCGRFMEVTKQRKRRLVKADQLPAGLEHESHGSYAGTVVNSGQPQAAILKTKPKLNTAPLMIGR
jgi:hypothetical protein